MTDLGSSPAPRQRRGFDLRLLIAALLGLYGAVLTVLGITDGQEALAKADGIRINLWIGLGLLLLAGFFAVWAWLAPGSGAATSTEEQD